VAQPSPANNTKKALKGRKPIEIEILIENKPPLKKFGIALWNGGATATDKAQRDAG
jgi:hypothetical protein